MSEASYDLFLSNLRAHQDAVTLRLSAGAAESFSDYREQVGILVGIETARQIFKETMKEITRQNAD